MKVSDFDYDLPADLIAQIPAERRDAARLLVHEVATDATRLGHVADLSEFLRAGDLLVLNDTRVLPARLMGRRGSGGRVEFLFVEPRTEGRWCAMVNPARKLKAGEIVTAEGSAAEVRMVERVIEPDGKPSAMWIVELSDGGDDSRGVVEILESEGRMPLPPYIERAAQEDPRGVQDLERYQTVYAREAGAVAAPTAGLHFDDALFERLETQGIERAFVTLHVGPGTFLPVKVEDVEAHRMHSERFSLSPQTVAAIEACRARGGRVIAVGTTSVRVLESMVDSKGKLMAGEGRTEIFIHPGCEFRVIDGLLTNFHLPRSTLLMLVATLAGRERILSLYQRAIEERLRFYSYGDAMLLLP